MDGRCSSGHRPTAAAGATVARAVGALASKGGWRLRAPARAAEEEHSGGEGGARRRRRGMADGLVMGSASFFLFSFLFD